MQLSSADLGQTLSAETANDSAQQPYSDKTAPEVRGTAVKVVKHQMQWFSMRFFEKQLNRRSAFYA